MEVVRRWISKLMRVECCRELLLVLLCSCLFSVTGTKNEGFSNGDGNELCFPVVGDIGGIPQHPYSTWTQRKVAILLGKVTEKLNCKFVLGVGDNFYYDGVRTVDDPRFIQTFESVYTAPSLHIPWHMIAGNHDHHGNVSAQIAYTKKSRRWHFPNFFYSTVHEIPNTGKLLEVLAIDTTMLCWYKKQSGAPDPDTQLKWIEEKLRNSIADYIVVAGHHPIFSAGKHGSTGCLQSKLQPLLKKYSVTAYFSGHDHNLQHIHEDNHDVHYFVSGSGNFHDTVQWHKHALPSGSLKSIHVDNGFLVVCTNGNELVINDVIHPKKVGNIINASIKPRFSITKM